MNFISKVSQHLTDWFCVESQSVGADSMPDLQSLEERVLYSASPIPIELFVEAPNVDVDLEQIDQQLDFLSEAVEQLQYDDSSDAASLQLDSDDLLPELVFGNEPELDFLADQPLELIVIDSAVENYQALYDDVFQNYGSDRVQIHLIDSNVDGVKEISRLLEEANDRGETFGAVHIVSHGDADEVQLGNVTLDEESLSRYTNEIAGWSDGLSNDPNILIYGSNLTADANGEMLIETINALTGAGVAASDLGISVIDPIVSSADATEADSGVSVFTETNTVSEDVTAEVAREVDGANQPAVAENSVTVGLENFGVQFTPTDFDFTDLEDDSFHSIRIDSAPVDGSMNPFGELTLFGMPIDQTVIDADGGFVIASGSISSLRWTPPAEVHGTNVATFEFSVRDGETWSAPATMQLDLSAEDRLWVSTSGDSSATTSIPGDGNGILQLGGTDPAYGEATLGFWSEQFTPLGFSVDAVHYVNRGIGIGSGNGAFLNAGDVLFSVTAAPGGPGPVAPAVLTLPSVNGSTPVEVMAGDIIRFRPTSSDLSTGNYAIVASLGQMYPTAPVDYELNAFSVVEQDTIVGDRLLEAGDILFSDSAGGNDIKVLKLVDTGSTSTGSISLLVEGSEVGISRTISGLDIVEARTTVGAGSEVILEAGSILASVDEGENVGANGLSVTAQDVFVIDLSSTTSATSIAMANASLFFDGSDVGGDENVAETSIDAVSLLGNADPATALVVEPGNIDINENEVYRFSASDFVSEATQSNLESVVITGLPDPAGGALLLRNEPVTVGQIVDADDLEFLVYQPEFNQRVDSDRLQYRAVSDSGILAESEIRLNVAPVADDVLIGSGTGVDAAFVSNVDIVSGVEGDQNQQEIAHIENGETVVVWRSSNDGVDEIRLQRFGPDLEAIGIEIVLLDNTISGLKTTPSVTGLDDGGFLVTATVVNGTNADIWAARFNDIGQHVDVATGSSLTTGPEILLGGASNQFSGDVARLQDGFVVVYRDNSTGSNILRARVFHDDGFQSDNPVVPPAGSFFTNPTVEQLEQGGFVVAWNRTIPFVSSSVSVQLFDTNGVAASSLVNLGSSANSVASVSVLENNQTVVVWSEFTPGNPDGANRIVGAILDTDGTVLPLGEITIAQVDSVAVSPNVVAVGDGGFVVAVSDSSVDSSPQSVVAYRFDSEFTATGPPQVITENNDATLFDPRLEYLPDSGEIVGVWNRDSVDFGHELAANIFRLDANEDLGERIPLDLTVEAAVGTTEEIDNLVIRGLPDGSRLFEVDPDDPDNDVEIFGPVFNLLGFNLANLVLELPEAVAEADYQLVVETNDNGAPATHTHELSAQLKITSKTLSGTIYNDVNADGLITGEDGITVEGGFEGVEVILYEEVGGVRSEFDRTQTFNSSGDYKFDGLDEGTYFVAVNSRTIGAEFVADPNNAAYVWAEQTYGGAGSIQGDLDSDARASGSLVGGRFANESDDASSLESSEHVIRRTIGATDLASVNADFGFSFNVVSNVGDAFDPDNPDARSVQGSLRQFIQNANFVIGPNQMRFVPAVDPNRSSDTDNDLSTGESWWSINPVASLPEIYDSGTILDGQAWSVSPTGLTPLDYNDFTVRDSYTGTVGTRGTAFQETDAPELEIVGNQTLDRGFVIAASVDGETVSDIQINNFSVHGFGQDQNGAQIRVSEGQNSELNGVLIQNNVIGSGPNDLSTDVAMTPSGVIGITSFGAVQGVISNNIIVGQTGSGISLAPFARDSLWTIVDNEITGNGTLADRSDGINTVNVAELSILRNVIHGNYAVGIDHFSNVPSTGAWTIEDNSVFNNGVANGPEGSGIRLAGDGAVVRYNSISDNLDDGITISGYFDQATGGFVLGSQNLISENSFAGNGDLAVDLAQDFLDGLTFGDYDSNSNGEITFAESFGSVESNFEFLSSLINDDGVISSGEIADYYDNSLAFADGVNIQDGIANANTANDGLDAIVVNSAVFDSADLNLSFEIANPNTDRIELYAVVPRVADSGETLQYFATIPISSLTDEGGGVFSVTIPASDFPDDIAQGTPVAALAFDPNNNTSEFSNNVATSVQNNAPLANDSSVDTNEEQQFDFSFSDFFSSSDPVWDSIVELIITSLPDAATGELLLGSPGIPVLLNQRIAVADVAMLTFVPVMDYFGVTTFDFAVGDGGLESAPATMSINVANISDAPTGQDRTIEIDEDEIASFDASNFGFSDMADNGLDAFDSVRIVDFVGGDLLQNSAAFVRGDLVDVGDLGQLQFVTPANANGNGIASIDFQVIDFGSSNNEDLTPNTITFDVTPVPDAPAGLDNGEVTIEEDGSLEFTPATFGFSDLNDNSFGSTANAFAGVRIVSFTGRGALTAANGSVIDGQVVDAAELGSLVFTPVPNESGSNYATIRFQVIDDGAANMMDLSAGELVIHVDPVSDAPTGTPQTLSIVEDQVVTFTESSFGFLDSDGDAFASVEIVAFVGTLQLNAVDINPGQIVDVVDLGDLIYQPPENQFGDGIGSIDFRVIDSSLTNNQDQTIRRFTFDATSVSDAPTGAFATITAVEDVPFNFDSETFGFSDALDSNPDNFAGVRILNFDGRGTLKLDGVDVVEDQVITAAELPLLEFLSAPNENGAAVASIEFKVIDDGDAGANEDSVARVLTVNVSFVDDFPFGQSDTITILEDSIESFTESTFGFDASADGTDFGGVRIVSFRGSGSLTINGIDVEDNTIVSADQLPLLRYQPAENEHGDALSTIEFQVRDASDENNEDPQVQMLVYNVTSVDDLPFGQSDIITILEDSIESFTESTFGFDSSADGNAFSGVRIVSFRGIGSLTINGIDVEDNTIVSVDQLPLLRYQPAENEHGDALSTIEFQVRDDSNDGNEDPQVQTLVYNVTAVSDAPVGTPGERDIDEDEVVIFGPEFFGFNDDLDDVNGGADAFSAVRILGFSGDGTLSFNGQPVQFGNAIDVNELTSLIYQPASNEFGSNRATVSFQVIDSGTGINEDAEPRELTFNINSLNDAPEGESRTITAIEDEAYTFTEEVFGFSDPFDSNPDRFESVQIVRFSGAGQLAFDGIDVVVGQLINVADLNRLVYQADPNVEGSSIDTIEFRVVDDGSNGPGDFNQDATERTLTVDVASLNDAPQGIAGSITILEGETYDFAESDFGFSDPDDINPNALQAVRIASSSGIGRLTLDGVDIVDGQLIDSSDISRLQFSAGPNQHGVATINFQVIDDGETGVGHFNEDTNGETITLSVTSVNDRPTGQDFSVELDEASTLSFTANQFQFDDSTDLPSPNNLQGIRIVDWSGPGRVLFDGVEIVRDTVVNVNDISRLSLESGNLAGDDEVGQITFTVIDDGGQDNGGQSESETHQVEFLVRQVNEAPVVLPTDFKNVENVIVSHLISVTDEDVNSTTLSFAGTDNDNSLFRFTRGGRSIEFLEAPDFESPASVSGSNRYVVELVARDEQRLSSEVRQIFIDVVNSETIPLVDDSIINNGSGFSGVSLFANDNDGVALPSNANVSVVAQPDSGIVTINQDGTFEFVSTSQVVDSEPVEFTYSVENGGEISTADVTFSRATLIGGQPTDGPVDEIDVTNDGDSDEPANPDSPLEGAPVTPQDIGDNNTPQVATQIPAPVNNNGANTINNDISFSDFDFSGSLVDSQYSGYTYESFVDTGLLISDNVSRELASSRVGIQELAEDFTFAAVFWEEMDSASHNYIETTIGDIETVITVGGIGSLAFGFFFRWILIGASVGATYSQPLWVTSFDLLPVIESDDESIEQIVDNQTE